MVLTQKATPVELAGERVFMGKGHCAECHLPEKSFLDNEMHDLKLERFYKTGGSVNDLVMLPDGPIETYTLGGAPINLSARSYLTTINIGNVAARGAVSLRHGKTVQKDHDEEVDMVRHFTAALVAALVLGSAGIASARPAWNAERVFAPSIQRYDGMVYPHDVQRYCYLPSSPCGNNHRVTN
jgi:hypothetical protein